MAQGRPKASHKLTDQECAGVFLMREHERKTWPQVAERFSCSVPTAISSAKRGKAHLRKEVAATSFDYVAGSYRMLTSELERLIAE